ncbi:hypothetical protein [Cupriavidus oxalaticus]|uniref:hypothetical protein n=1 Tax=Cupriavidus oxalaticus TaxID=96344 RepID=UPI001E3FD0C4|nr:hypothetical protein [Cupriavidus oxalaticus]
MVDHASRKGDTVAAGFQRPEQRLALELHVGEIRAAVHALQRPAQRQFEISRRVAARQRPEFIAAGLDLHPRFKLAGLGIDDAGVVGDQRPRGDRGAAGGGQQGHCGETDKDMVPCHGNPPGHMRGHGRRRYTTVVTRFRWTGKGRRRLSDSARSPGLTSMETCRQRCRACSHKTAVAQRAMAARGNPLPRE